MSAMSIEAQNSVGEPGAVERVHASAYGLQPAALNDLRRATLESRIRIGRRRRGHNIWRRGERGGRTLPLFLPNECSTRGGPPPHFSRNTTNNSVSRPLRRLRRSPPAPAGEEPQGTPSQFFEVRMGTLRWSREAGEGVSENRKTTFSRLSNANNVLPNVSQNGSSGSAATDRLCAAPCARTARGFAKGTSV